MLHIDTRIEHRHCRRTLQAVWHRHETRWSILAQMSASDTLRAYKNCKNTCTQRGKNIQGVVIELTHQHTGQERTDTGAQAIHHKQDGAQAHAAVRIDVVVRKRGPQRVERKLQDTEYARKGNERPERHIPPPP